MADVQEITRKKYDSLVSAQQKFYDGLVAKGQVKIIDEVEPEKEVHKREDKPKQDKPPGPLYRHIGKHVSISLMNGEKIVGTLKEVWQFEIVVDDIAILKHAVVSMREIA